ncbi:MAG: hypothetical protein U0Q12_05710 [Vicinamibacterales bacterium]
MRTPPVLLALAAVVHGAVLVAQGRLAFVDSFEHPAIAYAATPADDDVTRLNRALETGATSLAFDSSNGYLRAVVDALHVPIESQVLVFSQGSLQGPRIGPDNPRAIFFNDRVAVGWVREGLLEVIAQDAKQGPHFYTLDRTRTAAPRFSSSRECLRCHISWDTFGVPGWLVLSTIQTTDSEYVNGGESDHRTPFVDRWGGWFVTGSPGALRHRGNVVKPVKPDAPASRVVLPSVDGRFDPTGYPTPYSDIVALMVLEHQTRMLNLLTYVGWEARVAPPGGDVPPRVRAAAKEVVEYMLFLDEPPLAGRIEGSSGFAARFASLGPADPQGRSLRAFDLERRLFRYPCSYLIYSDEFDALPPVAKRAIYGRLADVLSGRDRSGGASRLSLADRRAIVEILQATKRDLPDDFRTALP